jgi:hypothetical protein
MPVHAALIVEARINASSMAGVTWPPNACVFAAGHLDLRGSRGQAEMNPSL